MRVSIILIGLGFTLGFSTSVRAVDPGVKCEAEKLKEAGVIRGADKVLLPLTGFGVKEPIPGY